MKISTIFIVIPLLLMVTKVAKGRFLLVKLAGTEDNGPRSKSGVSGFVQNLVAQGKYF